MHFPFFFSYKRGTMHNQVHCRRKVQVTDDALTLLLYLHRYLQLHDQPNCNLVTIYQKRSHRLNIKWKIMEIGLKTCANVIKLLQKL